MPYKKVGLNDLFECQKCGDCCKGYGGTVVTQTDIENIADFICSPKETFIKNYCQMSGKKAVLAQKEDKFCIFWDDLCTIHPVKPKMCRDWPFIKSVILEPKNWEIMSNSCPGIRMDFPLTVVEKCVRKKLSNDSLS